MSQNIIFVTYFNHRPSITYQVALNITKGTAKMYLDILKWSEGCHAQTSYMPSCFLVAFTLQCVTQGGLGGL